MVALDPFITIFTITCVITGAVIFFKYFPSVLDPPTPTSPSSSLSVPLSGLSSLLRGSRLSLLSGRSGNDNNAASITGTTASASSFSLEKAYASFDSYLQVAESEVQLYKTRFKTLRGAHKRFTVALEYPKKIDRLEQACSFNATITRGICVQAQSDFPHLSELGTIPTTNIVATKGIGGIAAAVARKDTDVSRVRESLKHLVRDWSREGQRERDIIFTPILNELMKVPEVARPHHKVFIPGSGLGRLAWEIAGRGFDTTSCELSYYMSLSLRFLLSSLSTWTTEQHKIQPFAHWWSHQRSNENTFRTISFPDELPRRLENWTILEEDFLSLSPPTAHLKSKSIQKSPLHTSPTVSTFSSPLSSTPASPSNSTPSTPQLIPNGYDTIVTLYFIDTASNIISYLQHIHYLLKPGGKWINLGPLLYSNANVELNLEEVLKLADIIGFNINQSSRRQVPSEYTADQHAMMKWLYQAEFWVASKRTDELFA